ncbi:hypothetical protein GUJ93_ZPchr0007g3835 [Zizania palustris]|uniref:Uncharacterized protein n=1 Tax=Zizania palustris TaxID=103762 RepID=A0A8J5STY4_ZIZPA|nr:hypothetical protein GUJ93_ZPchr0007g3835 [Zizania palustris]
MLRCLHSACWRGGLVFVCSIEAALGAAGGERLHRLPLPPIIPPLLRYPGGVLFPVRDDADGLQANAYLELIGDEIRHDSHDRVLLKIDS